MDDVEASGTMTISCDECSLDGTDACADCVVSFLLEPPGTGGVVVDAMEARAMRLLEGAGLVPSLRYDKRAG